jgi:hypothetical protein
MEQNRFDTKILYTTYITYFNDDDNDDFDGDDNAMMITLIMNDSDDLNNRVDR